MISTLRTYRTLPALLATLMVLSVGLPVLCQVCAPAEAAAADHTAMHTAHEAATMRRCRACTATARRPPRRTRRTARRGVTMWGAPPWRRSRRPLCFRRSGWYWPCTTRPRSLRRPPRGLSPHPLHRLTGWRSGGHRPRYTSLSVSRRRRFSCDGCRQPCAVGGWSFCASDWVESCPTLIGHPGA